MSGRSSWDDALEDVWRVLNRDCAIEPLRFLNESIQAARAGMEETRIAIGFDTNSVFRMGRDPMADDVLDYLRSRHDGPIIIPGQTLQEIWNNQLSGITPIARSLKTKFEDLERELAKIDLRFGTKGDTAKEALDVLLSDYRETLDEQTLETFRSTIALFHERAMVPFVPRLEFAMLASIRSETKTPPGYRDEGHGDFFVWADFLLGLRRSREDGIGGVVLVTNDTKPDWSRAGIIHPVLAAEAAAVIPRPFRLWTVADLVRYVRQRA